MYVNSLSNQECELEIAGFFVVNFSVTNGFVLYVSLQINNMYFLIL